MEDGLSRVARAGTINRQSVEILHGKQSAIAVKSRVSCFVEIAASRFALLAMT
jgi:hypothetical protein